MLRFISNSVYETHQTRENPRFKPLLGRDGTGERSNP